MSARPRAGGAVIADVAVALPETILLSAEVLRGVPEQKAALLAKRAGVLERHVAAPGQTALDLGEVACRELLARHPELADRLDILVFCTQTPDHLLPPNSCALHGRLGLPDHVMAFDLPHACSAFVYALQLVDALFVSGQGREALIVTADTYSKLINDDDRATRLLFGDGGAACWVSSSDDPDRGTVDIACGTDGRGFDSFVVPAGGARLAATDAVRAQATADASGNVRTPAQIAMDGQAIVTFAGSRVPESIKALLARNEVSLDEIDRFVFHQASSIVLDLLTMQLDVAPERVIRRLATTGNTVSASIPITLRKAIDEQLVQPGDLVLICGFGAGLSWGSALVRW